PTSTGEAEEQETFSFEEFEEPSFKPSTQEETIEEGIAPPSPSVSAEEEAKDLEEIALDDLGGEEFSLGDFGAEFGILETEAKREEEPAINIPAGAAEVIAAVAEEEEFTLSEEEFERFKQALATLPLNLKRAIEEVIGGNKASDADQIKLIRYLLSGERINTIAAFTGKLLGTTLRVPKGYEKRTGLAYEEERESLAYILKERVFPLVRMVVATALASTLVFYLAYLYIYRPLHARSLFQKGYELIKEGRYREGNAYFDNAYQIWADKKWFFRYADLFIQKKEYKLAAEKYEKLLKQYADYPHPRTGVWTERKKDSFFDQGILSYAEMESRLVQNYEKAEQLLKQLLDVKMYHWEGLLALGDNYMRWAEEVPDKYQQARITFGTLLQHYGDKDPILFRFLELFILTDEEVEVNRLKDYFQSKKKLEVDVLRYALLGGYLLDKGNLEDAQSVLMRAYQANPKVADVHYQLARYFNRLGKARDERIALDKAIELYKAQETLSRKELWKLIDTFRRDGDYRYHRREVLDSEKAYLEGIRRYEEALANRILNKNRELAKLYVGLGDLYFYEGQRFSEAMQQYRKAEDSLYSDPGMSYRIGYIYYLDGRYEQAILEFLKAEASFPSNPNVLFSLANAMFQRNNYFASSGYYQYLIEKLRSDRDKIRHFEPHVKPEDRALVLNLMKAYNNFGVALYRLSERTRNQELISQALVYFTESVELFENFVRDRETQVRGETKNLAYLNMRKIMNPRLSGNLEIYPSIPYDLRYLEF
ncbi:MAG: tetratricopeptide repeat protein, partial [Spirochaetales bacterium]